LTTADSPDTLKTGDWNVPVGQWLPLLRETLAREGSFRWQMEGSSMSPTLAPGCEIEIAPLTSPPALGELLVFVADDTLVIHRFVRHWQGQWIMQGDGRTLPDKAVRPEVVLGRVVVAYQAGEAIWPTRYSRYLALLWVIRYYRYRLQRLGGRAICRAR
jgi:hypothetical protein